MGKRSRGERRTAVVGSLSRDNYERTVYGSIVREMSPRTHKMRTTKRAVAAAMVAGATDLFKPLGVMPLTDPDSGYGREVRTGELPPVTPTLTVGPDLGGPTSERGGVQ